MKYDQLLVFDIEGEYGHFRKFNTTTSPLTYSTPPRTSIIGMIGAILGIERETGIDKFEDGQIPLAELMSPDKAQVAVQILNQIEKVQMGFNLLNTKNKTSFFNIENRTQIEFELLRSPKYRIFINISDETIFSELIDKVKNRKTHFTVSLGLSQMLATIDFVGMKTYKHFETGEYQPILSAVRMNLLDQPNPIRLENNNQFRYSTDTQPIWMNKSRVVQNFSEILIELTGQPIWVKSKQCFQVQDLGNIMFL